MTYLSAEEIRENLASLGETGESVARFVGCRPTVANEVIRVGAPTIGGARTQTRACAERIADLLDLPFEQVWGKPDVREAA